MKVHDYAHVSGGSEADKRAHAESPKSLQCSSASLGKSGEKTVKTNFVFGQVVDFGALAPNTIALDGAVQGPQIDAASRRFSFDHHAGCTRLVTLATCQQVALALELGLVVDEATEVVINDLDADTVVGVFINSFEALQGFTQQFAKFFERKDKD